MSKIKNQNSIKNISKGSFPIENNSKKDRSKKRKKIRKVLIAKGLKINKKSRSKKCEKKNQKNHISTRPEILLDSKRDIFPKPEMLLDSKHDISIKREVLLDSKHDIISSNQNFNNYSSNWKRLQQEMLNSKKSVQNHGKLKSKKDGMQNILDMENNNSKTITENINTVNKPLAQKNIMDASFVKSDAKYSEALKNIKAEQPKILEAEKTSFTEDLKNINKVEQSNFLEAERNSFTGFTKVVAIDCEMVGGGLNGQIDILARVSIVNQFGNVLYDKYVKPREKVVDYRTEFSGIREENLVDAESFEVVQKEVSKLLSGKIVVGHGVRNDFQCLYLTHPGHMIRDTSKFHRFRNIVSRRTPSLKKLCDKILGIKIQSGEHDSVQDARAALRLYLLHKKEWEEQIPKNKFKRKSMKRKEWD